MQYEIILFRWLVWPVASDAIGISAVDNPLTLMKQAENSVYLLLLDSSARVKINIYYKK